MAVLKRPLRLLWEEAAGGTEERGPDQGEGRR